MIQVLILRFQGFLFLYSFLVGVYKYFSELILLCFKYGMNWIGLINI